MIFVSRISGLGLMCCGLGLKSFQPQPRPYSLWPWPHADLASTSLGCLNPITGTGHTSVDIDASANLEFVDKFWYLGNMLSVEGDAGAAVENRIRIGWNKFRQLVPVLTNHGHTGVWLLYKPLRK